jgi:hypothetical protein
MAKMLTRFIAYGARTGLLRPVLDFARKVMTDYYTNEALHRIVAEKTAPLKAITSSEEPLRINIFIPEIDFRSFYGGYIAKFNFARKLVENGNRVRFITVDRCDTPRTDWPAIVEKYHGIEDIFDKVEVVTTYGREQQVTFNPADVIVATTWWTAHIVNQLLPLLDADRFLYFIQEYEPFTFPMGSYYALAHESYSFPHVALFSSPTLQEYFRINRFGVFAGGCAEEDSLPFENAILTFSTDFARERGQRKKLLFYSRPEAHAARNMFEIGYAALEKAIEENVFSDDWDIYGIGTGHDDIVLPKGRLLKMLGKVGLKEYRDMLPGYDVGLALMYTPHPSLLPIEMAAAGQVVVTNSCMNKTAQALQEISTNFVVAEPTIPAVAGALAQAVARADDIESRRQGSNVNWSQDWNRTFSDALLDRVKTWFPAVQLGTADTPGR